MRRAPHASATPSTNLTGEFGLLHAVDDRLAAYGYETNTGVRFVVVVDVRAGESRAGLRDADLRPVRCPSPSLPLLLTPPVRLCCFPEWGQLVLPPAHLTNKW